MRGGALGDFVLTLPVLMALRERFPTARLEVLAPPALGPLAVAAGLADGSRSLDARPMASFFAEGAELDDDWARWFGESSIVVSFLRDPRRVLERNLARCGLVRFIPGPWRVQSQPGLHASLQIFEALRPLGIAGPLSPLRLPLGGGEPRRHWLAVHPGSGSAAKNWPLEQWQSLLAELMRTTRWHVHLICGEADRERTRVLRASLPAARHTVADSLPLPELARELSLCEALIGHDSGVTHLAAAMSVPLVVLWGATHFDTWRPLSSRMQVLRGLHRITPQQVIGALRRLCPHAC